MAQFTPTQGRYLAFIHRYTKSRGYPPAESEIAAAMCVAAPSVNQMVMMLEKKGLILRQPGKPRSIQILVPEENIPAWGNRKSTGAAKRQPAAPPPAKSPPGNLYVLSTYLSGGPVSAKFANKIISRVIEIRGDQTLADLHRAIFTAYDRWEEHLYEFQLGKRPFDPDGPNYGIEENQQPKRKAKGKGGAKATVNRGDARTTRLDDLGLTENRVFGYWFDFGDGWYHQIAVEKIERAIATVTYPRVRRRVGKSPPQYSEE